MATSYVSLTEIKAYLDITGSTYDSVLSAFENESVAEFNSICNRNFATASGTVYKFDNFDETLIIKDIPITTLTSIYNDTTLIASTQYSADLANGIIYNLGAYLSNKQKILVTCDTGYSEANIPQDIKKAILIRIKIEWLKFKKGKNLFGVNSHSTEVASESYDFETEYSYFQKTANRYKVLVYV